MKQLNLTLFGYPQVEQNGVPVLFFRRHMLALLAYLAVTGQLHSRETLSTLLWPESDPSLAFANLRSLLAKLKKAVGPPWLDIQRESICFQLQDGLNVDVNSFRALLPCSLPHPQTQACPRCAPRLEEAAQLYRGDFLTGFTLRGSLPFDDWQRAQTESLRQEFAGVLQRLIPWYTSLGEYETALAHARRWLALDNLEEAAHRTVIQLLLQSGQRAAAQEQYQTCVCLLHEELALAPSPETAALAQTVEPGFNAKYAASHVLSTSILGRETDLQRVIARLAEPACRLLTLVGMGGIGKTRLAREVERETGKQSTHGFVDGAFFVSLEHAQSAADILLAIAESLKMKLDERADLETQVYTHLQEKNALLILDNFEHLLHDARMAHSLPPAVELLLALLHATPSLKLLITSRERLHLREEWVLELHGLEDASATQLFLERVRQNGIDLSLADVSAVTGICQRLEGLPLAIEMAASWLPALSLAQIMAELKARLDWLSTPMQDTPDRHRSLRAIFESSWKLLSSVEREALLRLTLSRGGISLEAAKHVTQAPLSLLASLRGKSLLQTLAPNRLTLHPLIRQFAAEKLVESPAGHRTARTQHSRYFMNFLAVREPALKGANQATTLDEIEQELENIQAGWKWAVETQQAFLSDAVEGLYYFFHIRSRLREGVKAFEMAVAATRKSDNRPLLTCLLARLGKFNLRLGEEFHAEESLMESLALAKALNLTCEAAFVLNELGNLMVARKDVQAAASFYQESLCLHLQTGDLFEQSRVLNNLGVTAKMSHDWNTATSYYQQSLDICRKTGNQRGLAIRLTNLGYLALMQKNYPVAEQHYQESQKLFQQLDDRSGVAVSLINLGNIALEMGDNSKAYQHFQDARALATEVGNQSITQGATEGLEKAEQKQRDFQKKSLVA